MLSQQLLKEWNALKTKLLKQKQSIVNLREDIQGKESALQFLRTKTAQNEKELETVKEELTTTKREIMIIKEQLTKEQGWWDKWLAEEETEITSRWEDLRQLPAVIYQEVGNDNGLIIELLRISPNTVKLVYKGRNNRAGSLLRGKKIIQTIAKYYKTHA